MTRKIGNASFALGTNIAEPRVVIAGGGGAGGSELFGRLSPILESEDDCETEIDRNWVRMVLKFEVVSTLEFAPWIDATHFPANNPHRTKPVQVEVAVQTRPTHGPLIDKYLETEELIMENKNIQVEMRRSSQDVVRFEDFAPSQKWKMATKKFGSSEQLSAEAQILRCLSTTIFATDLLRFFADIGSEINNVDGETSDVYVKELRHGITIRPYSTNATIIDTYCDSITNHYLILMRRNDNHLVFVEVWNMRNLLMPNIVETSLRSLETNNNNIPTTSSVDGILFTVFHPHFVVCRRHRLCVFSYELCKPLHETRLTSSRIVCCHLVDGWNLFFADNLQRIWRGRIGKEDTSYFMECSIVDRLPPFLDPPVRRLAGFRENREFRLLAATRNNVLLAKLHVDGRRTFYSEIYTLNSSDDALKRLSKSTITEIVPMLPFHFGVFRPHDHLFLIFSFDNPREPEFRFRFAATVEPTISLCWWHGALYTLTEDGVASCWRLERSSSGEGRKRRVAAFRLGLTNCKRIFAVGADKFVISNVDQIANFTFPN